MARDPVEVWGAHQLGEEVGVRQALFVPHHGPRLGPPRDQDVGPSPFGAQIILNGHNYVARRATKAGIGFRKEGNCFTAVDDPRRLARIADTLSQPATTGRLRQVCDRWIYSAALCFALDLSEQERGGARYDYSVYQAEYSTNLWFRNGAVMEHHLAYFI